MSCQRKLHKCKVCGEVSPRFAGSSFSTWLVYCPSCCTWTPSTYFNLGSMWQDTKVLAAKEWNRRNK